MLRTLATLGLLAFTAATAWANAKTDPAAPTATHLTVSDIQALKSPCQALLNGVVETNGYVWASKAEVTGDNGIIYVRNPTLEVGMELNKEVPDVANPPTAWITEVMQASGRNQLWLAVVHSSTLAEWSSVDTYADTWNLILFTAREKDVGCNWTYIIDDVPLNDLPTPVSATLREWSEGK